MLAPTCVPTEPRFCMTDIPRGKRLFVSQRFIFIFCGHILSGLSPGKNGRSVKLSLSQRENACFRYLQKNFFLIRAIKKESCKEINILALFIIKRLLALYAAIFLWYRKQIHHVRLCA